MGINLRKVGEVADGAVTTAKLADNAVTTAKAIAALKRHVYIGDETEVSNTGVTPNEEKSFSIAKAAAALLDWKTLHVQCMMKTSAAAHVGTMDVHVDDEETSRISIETESEAYELLSGNCDISDLGTGKHEISIRLKSADADETCYNELIDVFTEL
ncbi:MAG: hypothetical protein ACTSQZ_02015 [Candidatus Thorarchaeota archaeon]